MGPTGTTIALPGFSFDVDHGELRARDGALVPMRPQCVALMRRLARDVGHVVDKEALVAAVWPHVVVGDDSLVQCVGDLRRALDDRAHRVIQTEARRGYRLVATRAPGPAADAAPDIAQLAPDFAVPGFGQQIRFARAGDGVRLAWASTGRGTPVLRAAHWMTHLEYDWRSAALGGRIHAFARAHRYLRYDMRGSGLSDRDVDPGDVDTQADDLLAVADAAGAERFVLVGISAGAAVAIRVAARWPDRVHRMLLMGGFARGVRRRGEASHATDVFDAYVRLIEDGWGRDNPATRQLMTTQLYPGADIAQQRSFNEMQRLACSSAQAGRILRMVAHFDVTADLPRVRCPTLVVHARHDARVPFEEGRTLCAAIPDARLELLDTPNHMPLPGEPAFDALTAIVDAFIGEAPLAPPQLRLASAPTAGPVPSQATRARARR
jgi:pimeloyl-ACP methyl ester carboxylesterase/DNA-binding winged helix-turn-helix (wHTH) protein